MKYGNKVMNIPVSGSGKLCHISYGRDPHWKIVDDNLYKTLVLFSNLYGTFLNKGYHEHSENVSFIDVMVNVKGWFWFFTESQFSYSQGADSIKRCHLTSIGKPIVEIRRSYYRLICIMGFPILVRWLLYIESGPRSQTARQPLLRFMGNLVPIDT